ncbi:DUF3006 domain-containing protein [Salipaludibacillus sp. CF4.18]|uniref:DUF3006 domain-containing protein n=1 Tax=Salipaludibacillus sp. CF4.18 TaxID=3373081 RepID=UPI003EE6F90E
MMKHEGVLDRIVDGKFATILIEEIGEEFTLDVSELPDGSKEGMWFFITLSGDKIVSLEMNNKKTTDVENRVEEQLNRMRAKSKGSRFKRK